jgi:hypothetical protein
MFSPITGNRIGVECIMNLHFVQYILVQYILVQKINRVYQNLSQLSKGRFDKLGILVNYQML